MFFYFSQMILDAARGTDWAQFVSPLRVFRYITFRSAGAALTALALSWLLGPHMIAWLKGIKFGQEYADKAEQAGAGGDGPFSKRGTPTMGGLLIVFSLVVTTLLWAQWNTLVQVTLFSVVVL
jgi:phospho-N-acetylmuramoyl-pentapeptide-transferase